MFLQSMNTEMVSSQGTSLDQAIKLSSTYFDDKSKTSKLLILISDGKTILKVLKQRQKKRIGE
jgi:Ca-activated chloride channel family protein